MIFSLLIAFGSLSFCFLPRVIAKTTSFRDSYAHITVFTAGLQLATMLVDIIPHMTNPHDSHDKSHAEHTHTHSEHNHGPKGPFILTGIVFIFLLAVDVLVLHSKKSHSHDDKNNSSNNQHSHDQDDEAHHNENSSHMNEFHSEHKHGSCGENIGTCNTATLSKSKSKLQALITLMAISIHSFFEGLAVDSAKIQSSYNVGLILHKFLESFSVGASIFDSSFTLSTNSQLVIIYSFLTPFGIVCGNILREKSMKFAPYFHAASLGSMLFVVFIEMIGHSFSGRKNEVKLLSLASGYVIGCAVIDQVHE